MPEKYKLIRAANILGCTPWELESNADKSWIEWAFVYEKANNLVEKAMIDRPEMFKNND